MQRDIINVTFYKTYRKEMTAYIQMQTAVLKTGIVFYCKVRYR